MKRAALILAWIGVIASAAFLRFDDLTQRPMHADEATGARIMAKRMEGQGGEFNPVHYHGPLLADLTMPVCRMRGESTWRDLSKGSLRFVTASAGLLLVLVPLMWRRRMGDGSALLAAALLAVSPLLTYFSRMFIHEPLLALCGAAVLGLGVAFPRWGLPGVALGLMFAAKETFVISVLAWGGAVGLMLLLEWRKLSVLAAREWILCHGRNIALCLGAAAFTALLCYTHGFTHLPGALDAIRTYFVYETTAGHDKAWDYYLQLLAWPHEAAGVWWYGTPVVALAAMAYALSWGRGIEPVQRRWIQLLAHSVIGHFVIYSLFAYKTPWLASLPWALTCWLAGLSLVHVSRRPRWAQATLAVMATVCLWSQFQQTRLATGRYHSDARNPFAYVPSRSDVESLEEWLIQLEAMEGPMGRIAVVGSGYWPLPWYLRRFDAVGYWPEAPADLASCSIVVAMHEHIEALEILLEETHTPFPYGLRDGVPMQLFVSTPLWDQWYKTP